MCALENHLEHWKNQSEHLYLLNVQQASST